MLYSVPRACYLLSSHGLKPQLLPCVQPCENSCAARGQAASRHIGSMYSSTEVELGFVFVLAQQGSFSTGVLAVLIFALNVLPSPVFFSFKGECRPYSTPARNMSVYFFFKVAS